MGEAEGRGTPQRANAGAGGLDARHVPRGTPAAHAAARPDRYLPDWSEPACERKEEADGVTDRSEADGWRVVCRSFVLSRVKT